MKPIYTKNAPHPAGHYSQAVIHEGIVHVSGQLPVNPETGEKVTGDIGLQTEQALKNLRAVLEGSGSGMDCVLKTTVYISDIDLWDRVNEVYASFFGKHKPARAVVPAGKLHYGFLVEIEAVAYVRQGNS